jgi:hypothetical protein
MAINKQNRIDEKIPIYGFAFGFFDESVSSPHVPGPNVDMPIKRGRAEGNGLLPIVSCP